MAHPNAPRGLPAPAETPQPQGSSAQPAPSSARPAPYAHRDPARWLSSKMLVIITCVLAAALVATIIISFVVWYTPPLEPLNIPQVDQA